MIYTCPRCQKKNRLPETLQMDGVYRCGGCRQLLIGVSEQGAVRGSKAEAGKSSADRPPTPSARPAAAGFRRAVQEKYPQYPQIGKFFRVLSFVEEQLREARRRAVGRGTSAEQTVWRGLRGKLRKPPKALAWANGVYLLALLALAFSTALGPEETWLGGFNLYMPQWIWAVPGTALLLLTARFARRWAWVPLLALLWVFGPVMGFCWNGVWPQGPDNAVVSRGTYLRLMTYNVKWGSRDGHAIAADVRKFHPDILQMQDSAGVLNGELGQTLKTWNVRVSGQYIVASPHPLPELESRDISFGGSDHHCVRYVLQMGATPVTFYDVHLLSPRSGLLSVRHHQVGGMEGNADARLQEMDRLAGYVQAEQNPTILTGDLNAPVQALVCRKLFGAGLQDAFSEAGFGYGYTYGGYTRIGHPYVRIDHILASRQWRMEHCWAGNAHGSDHCPVVADLTLRQ